MTPDQVEFYEYEDLKLDIHHFDNRDSVYWIQSGIAAIQCSEDELWVLRDMINEYEKQIKQPISSGKRNLLRAGSIVLLILIFIALPALIFI